MSGKITKSQAEELAKDAEEIKLTPEEIEINMRNSNMIKVVPDESKELPAEFMIGRTKHFRNGNYEVSDRTYPEVMMKGNVYEFYDIVGAQFHQLKGKLYNLIESIGLNTTQEKAIKGLVKDFCNSKYKNTILDLEGWMNRMGFDIGEFGNMTANIDPLGDERDR